MRARPGKLASVADAHRRVFDGLEAAIRDGVFPGCVAIVWRDGATLYHEAHGRLASHAASSVLDRPVARDTIYDLASLTKVLATTTLAAQLVAQRRLALDEPVPDPWSAACPGATLADVLEHGSGLAAHREYFTRVAPFDADAVLHAVANTPMEYALRTRVEYSDLGFIILGAWIERVLGVPLDQAFADRVAYRLGLDATPLPALGFRRVFGPAMLQWRYEQRLAPTEVYDRALHPDGAPSWFAVREGVAHGAVHDDNAYVMGGVAGHAGLFGTADAVLEVALAWLEDRVPDVDTATRDRFWRASTVPGSTRRLGWDGTAPDGSGCTARALGPDAVGHTGFTGTSVWIDPGARLVAVLLSNRVHPTRGQPEPIKRARVAFHEAAAALR